MQLDYFGRPLLFSDKFYNAIEQHDVSSFEEIMTAKQGLDENWAEKQIKVSIEEGKNLTHLAIDCLVPESDESHEDSRKIADKLFRAPNVVDLLDETGSTPLHYAARKGNVIAVQLLIDNQANINAQDGSGNTPLNLAVQNLKPDVVKLLLDQPGIDYNLPDHHGETPLHSAVGSNIVDDPAAAQTILDLLAERNPDQDAVNVNGRTPLQEAAFFHNDIALKILLPHDWSDSDKGHNQRLIETILGVIKGASFDQPEAPLDSSEGYSSDEIVSQYLVRGRKKKKEGKVRDLSKPQLQPYKQFPSWNIPYNSFHSSSGSSLHLSVHSEDDGLQASGPSLQRSEDDIQGYVSSSLQQAKAIRDQLKAQQEEKLKAKKIKQLKAAQKKVKLASTMPMGEGVNSSSEKTRNPKRKIELVDLTISDETPEVEFVEKKSRVASDDKEQIAQPIKNERPISSAGIKRKTTPKDKYEKAIRLLKDIGEYAEENRLLGIQYIESALLINNNAIFIWSRLVGEHYSGEEWATHFILEHMFDSEYNSRGYSVLKDFLEGGLNKSNELFKSALLRAAQKGSGYAQWLLSDYLRKGIGWEKNIEQSQLYLMKAIANKEPRAKNELINHAKANDKWAKEQLVRCYKNNIGWKGEIRLMNVINELHLQI